MQHIINNTQISTMDYLTFPFKSERIRSAEDLSNAINEEFSPETVEKLHSFFKSIDFDMDEFMKSRSYNIVTHRGDRNLLLSFILNEAPVSCDLFPDIANTGYVELWGAFHNPDGSNTWKNGGFTHLDEDTMRLLYFCNGETDVWTLFAGGIGDIEKMFNYYFNENINTCRRFLKVVHRRADPKRFIRLAQIDNEASVNLYRELLSLSAKKGWSLCEDIREQTIPELMYKTFSIEDESFFDEDNYEEAVAAWDTGFLVIRQTFVRDIQALLILKRILDEEFSSDIKE